MIIPLRDYEAAAESRFKLGLGLANGLASDIPGGLWNATTVKEQIAYFNKIMANYVLQMVRWHIPTIFLDFDKMISSPEYLYNQLQPILNKISYDTFKVAYNKASDNQRKAILSPRT